MTTQQSRYKLRVVTAASKQAETWLLTSTSLSDALVQQFMQAYSVHVICMPELTVRSPMQMWHTSKRMKQLLLTQQPDIIHVHGAWNPLLALMEHTARKSNFVTCVSPYGGMAPEILNTDFVKTKMLPFLLYQAPMIRRSTSLIATSEKEAQDIGNLNLKKRVEVLPPISDGSEQKNIFSMSLLAAYRKAIDSSYKSFITTGEEMLVEQCLVASTTSDFQLMQQENLPMDDIQSIRRVFLYAYDEDVIDRLHDGASRLSKNLPPLIDVERIPRYADRKAKKRGGISELPQPKRRLRIAPENDRETTVVQALLRVKKAGIQNLTLRHKRELYDIFRNTDFNEDVVAAELRRLGMKKFTRRIQDLLHAMYNMPEGYDIF